MDKINGEIVCEDQDFHCAMEIVKVLYLHAKKVALSFKSKEKAESLGHMSVYFNALPGVEFTRAKAIQVAKKVEIKERSADRYLQDLISKKLLIKVRNGIYKKK